MPLQGFGYCNGVRLQFGHRYDHRRSVGRCETAVQANRSRPFDDQVAHMKRTELVFLRNDDGSSEKSQHQHPMLEVRKITKIVPEVTFNAPRAREDSLLVKKSNPPWVAAAAMGQVTLG